MKNILFFGCGKMGSILLNNLIESGVNSEEISVIKKTSKDKISGIKYYKNHLNLPSSYKASFVFIAIKPQEAKEILLDLSKSKIFNEKTIFISILAGKKINFFENIFGKNSKIVRSMPNLPIQYSQGIIAYIFNKNINNTDKKIITKIFENFGTCIQLKNEKDFDIITAIFGSGPAYIFLLEEIVEEIVNNIRNKKIDSSQLVKQLFLGSALMSCNSNSFSELRKSVTSKAGVTNAALEVFQKNSALKKLFTKAITQASKKSKELSDV